MYLNGKWVKPEEAVISVFDRGFLSAEAVYETLRTYGRKIFAFSEHYQRLKQSAEGMKIALPFCLEELLSIIQEGIEKNVPREEEAYIRVQVTSGTDWESIKTESFTKVSTQCTSFVLVKPMPFVNPTIYEKGVKTGFSPIRRKINRLTDHTIKTTAAIDIFLSRINKPKDWYDAILLTEQGYLAEGTFSNLFFVKANQIFTPSLSTGILAGITREWVLTLSKKAGYFVQEGLYNVYDVLNADEIFFTHTSASVVPVSRIETLSLPVGAVTKKLLTLVLGYIDEIKKT